MSVYTNILGVLFLLSGFYFCRHELFFYGTLCRMELHHEPPEATLNAIKFDLMTSTDMVCL